MSQIAVTQPSISAAEAIRRSLDAEQRRKERELISDASIGYLREHDIPNSLNAIIERILVDMPGDPLKVLEEQLRIAAKRGLSPPRDRQPTKPVAGGGAALRNLRQEHVEGGFRAPSSGTVTDCEKEEVLPVETPKEVKSNTPPPEKLPTETVALALERVSAQPTPREEAADVASDADPPRDSAESIPIDSTAPVEGTKHEDTAPVEGTKQEGTAPVEGTKQEDTAPVEGTVEPSRVGSQENVVQSSVASAQLMNGIDVAPASPEQPNDASDDTSAAATSHQAEEQ